MGSASPYFRWLRRTLQEASYKYRDWQRETLEELTAARVATQILKTPPLPVDPEADTEVITLTCHRDLFLCLLAIKSLHRAVSFSFRLTVIDDGSFTQRDLLLLQHHFPGLKIVRRQELNTKIRRQYGSKSKVYAYRDMPYIRKKAGIDLVTSADKILFVDSDVLFFGRSAELDQWQRQKNAAVFIQDCFNSYFLSFLEAKHIFGFEPLTYVNSGLVGLPKKEFSAALLEKVAYEYWKTNIDVYRPPQMQLFFALLFAQMKRKGLPVKRLPARRYVVSNKVSKYKDCVAGHYVRSVRQKYYTDALKVIQALQAEAEKGK